MGGALSSSENHVLLCGSNIHAGGTDNSRGHNTAATGRVWMLTTINLWKSLDINSKGLDDQPHSESSIWKSQIWKSVTFCPNWMESLITVGELISE